jgi:hypothetical protein
MKARYLLIAAAAGSLGPTHARAAESYDACNFEITSLPAVLGTAGTWCLKKDLGTAIATGTAVYITANNVTLDCNGFRLGGLAAGPATQTEGVVAGNRQNVVIRNCLLRGFLTGVHLVGGTALIEDNRIDGMGWTALWIETDQSTIRRNLVSDTGGSPHASYAMGIWAHDTTDVHDNTVSGVQPAVVESAAGAYGILVSGSGGATVAGNTVRGVAPTGEIGTTAIMLDAPRSIAEGNRLVGDPAIGGTSIHCTSTGGASVRNTIVGFAAGATGCAVTQDVVTPL